MFGKGLANIENDFITKTLFNLDAPQSKATFQRDSPLDNCKTEEVIGNKGPFAKKPVTHPLSDVEWDEFDNIQGNLVKSIESERKSVLSKQL
jgi:hypothetical protein